MTLTPGLASIPAVYQLWAAAPHSEDRKVSKQDKHLKLPPQNVYVSLRYHSFRTKRYHTGVLTAVAGTALSARAGRS